MPKRNKKGKANLRRNKLNQFEREQKYGKITMWRAWKEWQNICNRITVPKLRQDVIITSNAFAKVIDAKDFIISLNMDEIRNQEESHMVKIRHNYDNIDKMMETCFIAFYGIHEDTTQELQNMIQKLLHYLNTVTQSVEDSATFIHSVSYGMDEQRKMHEKQMKSMEFGEMNEITTKYTTDVTHVTTAMEDKFEKTLLQIRKIQDEYAHYIKMNKNKYDAIRSLDDANTATVERELNKLMGLQELLKRLTAKWNGLDVTLGQKLRLLESERDSLKEYFIVFKSKLQDDRKRDDVSRTLITVEFSKAFDYLNEKLIEGEKMLKILNCCRRFENINEKVMPFPLEDQLDDPKQSTNSFLLFWQKIGVVQANRCELNEERNYLKLENKKLKQQIHNHCQCFYCPILPPIPTRVGRIPHTDGKNMIRKQDRQNRRK